MDILTTLSVIEYSKEKNAPDSLIESVTAATNAYVSRLPVCEGITDPVDVPDDVRQGALMYAARLLRRRGSPSGIESLGEAGVSFTARYDSDIDRLLQIGAFARPVVA